MVGAQSFLWAPEKGRPENSNHKFGFTGSSMSTGDLVPTIMELDFGAFPRFQGLPQISASIVGGEVLGGLSIRGNPRTIVGGKMISETFPRSQFH